MSSFISSFIGRVNTTNSDTDSKSTSDTSYTSPSRSNSIDEKISSNHHHHHHEENNNLVMPFARAAGPDAAFGFPRGLNSDSPPLTPTSENGGRISADYAPTDHYEQLHNHNFRQQQQPQRHHYQTAKHQWSTAQANADAAGLNRGLGFQDDSHHVQSMSGELSPVSRGWAFSPPLTASSSRASPVQSLRAFSPPARPSSTSSARIMSTSTPLGLLPSHSEDSMMMVGSHSYPLGYDYHPGKSPPPTDDAAAFSSSQAMSMSTSTSTNLTSTRLRLSLQSLIPRSLSRNQNRVSGEGSNWKMPPLRPHLPTIMSVLILLVTSTIILTMALSTLPLHLPRSISALTLSEIRELCSSLKVYAESSSRASLHTLAVMSSAFVFLHTFNVPGSLLLNVIFGATFGTFKGTIYTSLLTAIGGTGCYLICERLSPIIKSFPGLEKPLNAMRKALSPKEKLTMQRRSSRLGRRNSRNQPSSSSSPSTEKFSSRGRTDSPTHSGRNSPTSPTSNFDTLQKLVRPQSVNSDYPSTPASISTSNEISSGSSLWSYLLLLRVLPIVPYGVMNVACGVLGVPILPFFATLGVGSIPWNAVTAQSGELLLDIAQAVSEGFEEFKVADISNQIQEKLSGVELIKLAGDATEGIVTPSLLSSGPVKDTQNAAKSGLKIILKRIWKKEMLIRLGCLTLIVLLPIIIASLLKRRKEKKEREDYERLRLIEEEEDEVLDEEEGRLAGDDNDDVDQDQRGAETENEKVGHRDEETEMRAQDGIPISNSSSSNWSRYSWNSAFSAVNSEPNGNARQGHKRMATDG